LVDKDEFATPRDKNFKLSAWRHPTPPRNNKITQESYLIAYLAMPVTPRILSI